MKTEEAIQVSFTEREFAVVLAALRFWQSKLGPDNLPAQANTAQDFGPFFDDVKPTSVRAIDRLVDPVSSERHKGGNLGRFRDGKMSKADILASLRTPEHQSKAGRQGAAAIHTLKDKSGKSIVALKSTHNRWHVARGIRKAGCSFCEELYSL